MQIHTFEEAQICVVLGVSRVTQNHLFVTSSQPPVTMKEADCHFFQASLSCINKLLLPPARPTLLLRGLGCFLYSKMFSLNKLFDEAQFFVIFSEKKGRFLMECFLQHFFSQITRFGRLSSSFSCSLQGSPW